MYNLMEAFSIGIWATRLEKEKFVLLILNENFIVDSIPDGNLQIGLQFPLKRLYSDFRTP